MPSLYPHIYTLRMYMYMYVYDTSCFATFCKCTSIWSSLAPAMAVSWQTLYNKSEGSVSPSTYASYTSISVCRLTPSSLAISVIGIPMVLRYHKISMSTSLEGRPTLPAIAGTSELQIEVHLQNVAKHGSVIHTCTCIHDTCVT